MRFLSVFALLFITACAPQTSTQAISYIDPSWSGQRINHILVEARNMDLRARRAIEYAAVDTLGARGIAAQTGVDVFLPTRDYSDKIRTTALKERDLRYVLQIEPTGKLIERSYIPPSRGYGLFGYGAGGRHGGGLGVGIDTGLTLEEPLATYHVTLASVGAPHALWVGDFTVRGPTGMRFDTLGARLSGAIITKLAADGFL